MSEAKQSPFTPTHVAILCHDKPDSQAARRAAAQQHLRYVESVIDRVAVAGPLFSDDGQRMIGSLYVFKTTSVAEARALLERDPYFQAAFWERVEYRPFLPAAGDYVGGTLW